MKHEQKFFKNYYLTLPKSTEKCWLQQDLNFFFMIIENASSNPARVNIFQVCVHVSLKMILKPTWNILGVFDFESRQFFILLPFCMSFTLPTHQFNFYNFCEFFYLVFPNSIILLYVTQQFLQQILTKKNWSKRFVPEHRYTYLLIYLFIYLFICNLFVCLFACTYIKYDQ